VAYVFDTDTRVTGLADGRYAVEITDRWNALGNVPNGGYLLAICLRALAEEMPYPDPLTVSANYLRPGVVGPAEVHTRIARVGRRIATGEATLVCQGKETVRVVASFADLDQATGRTTLLGEPPKLPAPEKLPELMDGRTLPGLTVVDRVDYRFTEPLGWMLGRPSGEPSWEFWMRFKDGRPADPLSLSFFVDAMAPTVLDLGELGSTTVQLTVYLRGRPAPGWLACRVGTRYLTGGFHEEDMEIWDSTGTLVAQSRQLALVLG